MRRYRLRALLTAAALVTTGVAVTGTAPVAADIVEDCGLACPVGVVRGSGSFPATGTGPFTLTLTGSAVSLRRLVGADASLAPVTVQAAGLWKGGCGGGDGSNPLAPVLAVVGAAVVTVARILGMGNGCGKATVNGTELNLSIIGIPSAALSMVATDGLRVVAVIALAGNPSSYTGVISNVNPSPANL